MTPLLYQYYSPAGLEKHKQLTNSSRLVIEEAERLGISWNIHPGTQVVTLSYKGQSQSYYHQVPSTTTALAKYITGQKKVTTNLLHEAGIQVPRGFRITRKHDRAYIRKIYQTLHKPLVVKPNSGTWGEHISVDIATYEEYLQAIKHAFAYPAKARSYVIAEEMFVGTEYRILLTREKVIGILHRKPANVVGDGTHTIEQLVAQKNQEPIRSAKDSRKSHIKIRIDEQVHYFLKQQQLTANTIPEKDRVIYLKQVSNVSQGGDAHDVTELVHPSVIKLALRAIHAIPGLSFAGIDFMTTDISTKQSDKSYCIIEINDSPGFDIHVHPYRGTARPAARAFLELLFPDLVTTN